MTDHSASTLRPGLSGVGTKTSHEFSFRSTKSIIYLVEFTWLSTAHKRRVGNDVTLSFWATSLPQCVGDASAARAAPERLSRVPARNTGLTVRRPRTTAAKRLFERIEIKCFGIGFHQSQRLFGEMRRRTERKPSSNSRFVVLSCLELLNRA